MPTLRYYLTHFPNNQHQNHEIQDKGNLLLAAFFSVSPPHNKYFVCVPVLFYEAGHIS